VVQQVGDQHRAGRVGDAELGARLAMAAWGVTPQAQNTGSSSGITSTASP
jgi:hypothetical protein